MDTITCFVLARVQKECFLEQLRKAMCFAIWHGKRTYDRRFSIRRASICMLALVTINVAIDHRMEVVYQKKEAMEIALILLMDFALYIIIVESV